jgi:hypothetical protein
MLKGRPTAIENRTKGHTTLLAYLALLVLTNANDIHINPGPERDYLCGTCDKTVDWEDRGMTYLCSECSMVDCTFLVLSSWWVLMSEQDV